MVEPLALPAWSLGGLQGVEGVSPLRIRCASADEQVGRFAPDWPCPPAGAGAWAIAAWLSANSPITTKVFLISYCSLLKTPQRRRLCMAPESPEGTFLGRDEKARLSAHHVM